MTRQYNNRGQQINIETVQGNVVVQKSTRSNAEWTLLQEVDREVESRLDQSLHNAALINLGKQSQPEQVKRIWDAEVKIGAKPPEPLPPDVGILDVFERSDIAGKLLILGDPGAGKTTTMLDLAQALIDKAKQDANDSIPVLINLSGWQEPRQSMPDWLVEELKSKYGVRKDIGKQWLQEKRLLPLLDGLDEVKPEHQEACVQAINQWLQSDSRPVSVVVCSRREEYANSQTQLHLNGAILLQALTEKQIQDYLINVNRTELWQILQQDAVLLDLMKTPLLLSITVLSYEALSLQQWHQLTSTQQRLNLLLDTYIQTMLHREFQSRYYRKRNPPTVAQTRHWLIFLAQQLQRESQTEFLIEEMQPGWLSNRLQYSVYRNSAGLFLGLVFALGAGLPYGIIGGLFFSSLLTFSSLLKPSLKQLVKLHFGERLWLILNLIDRSLTRITPVEGLGEILSSDKIIRALLCMTTITVVLGIIFNHFSNKVFSIFVVALVLILISRSINKYASSAITRDKESQLPNQGIWNSLFSAIGVGIFFGSIVVPLWLFGDQNLSLFLNIYLLCFVVISGGLAFVQHILLRIMLYRNGSIPWNYARFLNYCTERLFLQRVGGRYRFVHKLLQERFAELGNR